MHHSLKCLSDCLQVIRHLRTNRSCGSALTTSVLEQTQPGGADKEPCLPQNRPPPRPVRSLSCFQCNAMFKTKAELLSHQRTHRARPIYHCVQCDKEFHHLSSLTNHKQTHLDKGGFTCSRCNKVFESAKDRDAHRLQHRLPDLTCTMCDQTFSSQTRLLRHLQTHSVEGAKLRYNCRFCDQTFSGRPLKAVNPTNSEHFPRAHWPLQLSSRSGFKSSARRLCVFDSLGEQQTAGSHQVHLSQPSVKDVSGKKDDGGTKHCCWAAALKQSRVWCFHYFPL